MIIKWQSRRSRHFHIAVDPSAKKNGLERGRLVNMKNEGIGPLVPVESIATHMPEEDFVPFTGDPAPILAVLERCLREEREEQEKERASRKEREAK